MTQIKLKAQKIKFINMWYAKSIKNLSRKLVSISKLLYTQDSAAGTCNNRSHNWLMPKIQAYNEPFNTFVLSTIYKNMN